LREKGDKMDEQTAIKRARGLNSLPYHEQRILIEEASESYRTIASHRNLDDLDRDDAELLTIKEAGMTA
jgi:hypothetical protein